MKWLQRFLGFASFYRWFIKDYSHVAVPLSQLTSTARAFKWTHEADLSFLNLKKLFSSTLILCHPDPNQFILEVDASDTRVGAVFSQRPSSDNKVHPCALFSHRLSQAEQNCDVGHRELLAVKLDLEEWRHWLEGSETPCLI